MYDILTLILALIALALSLIKPIKRWRINRIWRGGWIAVGGQARQITKADETTITVDKPFDSDSNDNVFFIK